MMFAELTRKTDSEEPYYVLELQGGHEMAKSFMELYDGELRIYPKEKHCGIQGCQEQNKISFIITVSSKVSEEVKPNDS